MAMSFAPGDRARKLIATYPRNADNVDRVLLALADGDLASLADVAKLTNYRDVFSYAAYTGEGKLTSDVARASLFANFDRVPKALR